MTPLLSLQLLLQLRRVSCKSIARSYSAVAEKSNPRLVFLKSDNAVPVGIWPPDVYFPAPQWNWHSKLKYEDESRLPQGLVDEAFDSLVGTNSVQHVVGTRINNVQENEDNPLKRQLSSACRKLCDKGRLTESVEVLDRIVHECSYVSRPLLYRVLKRCIVRKNLVLGKRVHALAVKCGYESNTFLANHIICMYGSHGKLEAAKHVLSKVVAPDCFMWASIILAHARQGQPTEAIELYHKMKQSALKPDNHIFVAILKACATAGDLASGKLVHADILSSMGHPDVYVFSSLIDMYVKCGSVDSARSVFDRLPTKNVVTWNSMIAGYAEKGLGQEALSLHTKMQEGGLSPSPVTISSLLKACTSVGALHQGRQLHAQIRQRGLQADVVVGTCLMDMYAKCGRLEDACGVFAQISKRDVVTWNTLLSGYAQHNDGQMAIRLFEKLLESRVEPDDVTFSCLLVACSHAGLVSDGQRFFNIMTDYGIVPSSSHYNILVDLFARSGHLEKAEEVLRTMPCHVDKVGWISLLSACKSYGDVERGRRCFAHIVLTEPDNAAAHALMATLYATVGRLKDAHDVENLRRSVGAKKKPAKACIEVKNEVHEFTVGEERTDISLKLRSVNSRLKNEGGHVPQTELVLRAVSEQEKEDALCGHAEKLALAFGLLNTPDGSTLLVTKNLRMCNDCHNSTKVMSRMEKREIVVRDAHRVHRFVDGACSCGDRH